MRNLLLASALLFSGVSQAAIIDFDSEPLGGVGTILTIGDFQFQSYASGMQIIEESSGDNALYMQASGSVDEQTGNSAGPIWITMTSTSGNPFAFFGADIVGTSLNGEVYFGINGVVPGGNDLYGPFLSDPIGTGGWLSVERVTFEVIASHDSPGFDTLSVTVDNVNASVVPVPAAIWLFGSAVAGLGWLRRKQSP